MLKILLVCSGGYTSSQLAAKMNAYDDIQQKYWVKSTNVAAALSICSEYDVVLLSPQVEFTYELFLKKLKLYSTMVIILKKEDYFLYNISNIFNEINNVILDQQPKNLEITFVFKEKGNLLFEHCFDGLKNYIETNKINIKLSKCSIQDIFSNDFESDLLALDYNFVIGNISDYHQGFITSNHIPFLIIHIYYLSGFHYRELVKLLFDTYKKAYENIDLEIE